MGINFSSVGYFDYFNSNNLIINCVYNSIIPKSNSKTLFTGSPLAFIPFEFFISCRFWILSETFYQLYYFKL